jgi:TM2 domain-containing membrane protein YozV
MTPKELREWLFRNSWEDQWWIAFDGFVYDCLVTVKEIEEKLKGGQYAQAHVLHFSQTEFSNPPWIEVELPAPILPSVTQPLKNPGVAAVLSFFFPGVGQIYNGQIVSGIIGFVTTIALYIFFHAGFLIHIYLVYSAFTFATKLNKLIINDRRKDAHRK